MSGGTLEKVARAVVRIDDSAYLLKVETLVSEAALQGCHPRVPHPTCDASPRASLPNTLALPPMPAPMPEQTKCFRRA